LNEAVSVVKFVKYRHALAGKYAELQGPMSVSKTLAMPVATRWCSQHTCVRNLLDAKAIIIAISNTVLFLFSAPNFSVIAISNTEVGSAEEE